MYFASRLKLIAGAAALACASAQGTVVSSPGQTTYYFNANCTDCAQAANAASYGVLGTLVLDGYTPGSALTESQFVSFSYSGSNLVAGFSIDAQTLAADLGGEVSGNIPSLLPAAADFYLRFGDGVGFLSRASDGLFFVCNYGSGYGGPSCQEIWRQHNDTGTVQVSTVNSTVLGPGGSTGVPEPTTALLVGLGLFAAAASRRRGAPMPGSTA